MAKRRVARPFAVALFLAWVAALAVTVGLAVQTLSESSNGSEARAGTKGAPAQRPKGNPQKAAGQSREAAKTGTRRTPRSPTG